MKLLLTTAFFSAIALPACAQGFSPGSGGWEARPAPFANTAIPGSVTTEYWGQGTLQGWTGTARQRPATNETEYEFHGPQGQTRTCTTTPQPFGLGGSTTTCR